MLDLDAPINPKMGRTQRNTTSTVPKVSSSKLAPTSPSPAVSKSSNLSGVGTTATATKVKDKRKNGVRHRPCRHCNGPHWDSECVSQSSNGRNNNKKAVNAVKSSEPTNNTSIKTSSSSQFSPSKLVSMKINNIVHDDVVVHFDTGSEINMMSIAVLNSHLNHGGKAELVTADAPMQATWLFEGHHEVLHTFIKVNTCVNISNNPLSLKNEKIWIVPANLMKGKHLWFGASAMKRVGLLEDDFIVIDEPKTFAKSSTSCTTTSSVGAIYASTCPTYLEKAQKGFSSSQEKMDFIAGPNLLKRIKY